MELYLACKQRQLYRPVNHRVFRETAPWPSGQPSRSVFPKKDTPPLQPHPQGREGSFWIIAKKEVHRRWLLYFCRPWLVSLAFAYPKFVIMMHNVALTQTRCCARYGNGVRIDGICVNCTDYEQMFCGFVLLSATVLPKRRTKSLQLPVQQNV